MRLKDRSHASFSLPSFAPLRASLWAVLGLSAAACGGNVTVEPSGGDGGGGDGGGGGTSTTVTSTSPTTTTTGTITPTVTAAQCAGAVPLPQANGADSGFAQCPDGTIFRDHAAVCDTTVSACAGDEVNVLCKSDAECTDYPNGKCAHFEGSDFGGETSYCGCAYPCTSDSDCQPGTACVCAGVVPSNQPWPTCSTAACRTGADCASGECGISSYEDGCGYDVEMACRAPDDACRVDGDCGEGYQCVTPYGSGEWTCETYSCAAGRPLMVDGQARTAARVARSDWRDGALTPETSSLSPEVRAALAISWRDIAAMEHASIASFARFSLELLALGAPPELLFGAQQAAADEIAHTQIAYALAGAYAGCALGPARLDVTGVVPATEVAKIVASLVEEACVGETIGAAEARALAGLVRDPALAAVYARIADEEGRHAELGWRTLGWLLRGAGQDVRDVAARTFDKAIAAMRSDPRVASDVVSPEHGLLSSAMLGALRRQALNEVIAPCARALLDESSAPAPCSTNDGALAAA